MVSTEMLIVMEGLRGLNQEALDMMCNTTSCSGITCHECPVNSELNMSKFVKTLEENGHD